MTQATSSTTIKVIFFASLRESVGVDTLYIQASNMTQLFESVSAQCGVAAVQALQARNVQVAINQSLVRDPAEFREGDVVAFMPPVTGG